MQAEKYVYEPKAHMDKQSIINKINGAVAKMSMFYRLLFRYFKIQVDENVSTLGVWYDAKRHALNLVIGPKFFEGLDETCRSEVLKHEMMHVVFKHVMVDAECYKAKKQLSNLAMDLEINQLLDVAAVGKMGGCYVGQSEAPWEMWAKGQTWEFYLRLLESLPEEMQTRLKGEGGGEGEGLLDQHMFGEPLTEEQAAALGKLVERVVRGAVRMTGKDRGLGTEMEAKLVEYGMGDLLEERVPWQTLLQNLLSNCRSHKTYGTYKKHNKKLNGLVQGFGGTAVFPGLRRKPRTKVLVAVDESGSVSDGAWAALLDALKGMDETAEWDVVPFDGECHWENMVSPGVNYSSRHLCGGTDFTNVIEAYNQHGKGYSALVILTDGGAPAPSVELAHGSRLVYVVTDNGGAHLATGKSVVFHIG